MNKLDLDYQNLLRDILENGVEKRDRTGTGTLSVFGRQIRHKMSDGFPLLTTKKMAWKTMVTELLWFLRGDTNIKYLVDNGCNIWNGDAYKGYEKEYEKGNAPGETLTVQRVDGRSTKRKLSMEKFIALIQHDDEFAEKWGDLGKVYGKQWRSWYGGIGLDDEEYNIDQIQNLIDGLKSNPDSRRLMVSAWNVGELDQMTLPPCHYGFQIYTRELSEDEKIDLLPEKKGWDDYDTLSFKEKIEKGPQRAISLMWNQRSVDTPLGLPFNIASYGLLLMMIAQEVNMVPDELIGNLGDCHIYLNQIEGVKEQIGRELTDEERYDIWFTNNYETGMERFFNPEKLPDFENSYYTPTPKRTREPFPLPTVKVQDGIYCSSINDFLLENYQSHPPIKFPLSN